MLITHLSQAISQKIIETGKRCPNRIKAAMLTHYNSPLAGYSPKNLIYYTIYALLHDLVGRHNISYVGLKKSAFPVKGATLYEHVFAMPDGKEFFIHELTTQFPNGGLAQLASTIQEMMVSTGCNHCLFGAKRKEDEDYICTFCQNDKIRNMLAEKLGDSSFKLLGWPLLAGLFGEKAAFAIEDLARFDLRCKQNTKFLKKAVSLIENPKEHKAFGSYLGQKVETALFMAMIEDEDQDEEGVE